MVALPLGAETGIRRQVSRKDLLGVGRHRSELPGPEDAPVAPSPLLPVEHGTRAGNANCRRSGSEDWSQEEEAAGRGNDIEETLKRLRSPEQEAMADFHAQHAPKVVRVDAETR
jgi:hypothetical protein